MKIKDGIEYLKVKAKEVGYTDKMFTAFEFEIVDRLNMIEDLTVEELETVFDEIF